MRSSLRSPCCVFDQDAVYFPKVLVIPRNRLLRPDMTEKLLTMTLSKHETKNNQEKVDMPRYHKSMGVILDVQSQITP